MKNKFKTFNFELLKIKAITFDLDDTLYDNRPVIKLAEAQFIASLQEQLKIALTLDEFNQFKAQCAIEDPDIVHDVITWRMAAILNLFHSYQLNLDKKHLQIAQQAMDVFVHYRHQIDVDVKVHQLLSELKKQYRLATITNGNVEVDQIGLSPYFDFALRAGLEGKSKPEPDLFLKAQSIWQLPADSILHVGDNFATDVLGAYSSNLQTCWLCETDQVEIPQDQLHCVNLKIQSILDLRCLLDEIV